MNAAAQFRTPLLSDQLLSESVQQNGVEHVLRAIRKHLGMEVAYISRFRENDRVFTMVDAEGAEPLCVGQVLSFEQGYCFRVASGLLPALIPDTAQHPEAAAIPETQRYGIAAHLGVPLLNESGEIFGTLCFFRHSPDHSLRSRDLELTQAFAEVLSAHLQDIARTESSRTSRRTAVLDILRCDSLDLAGQPIYDLKSGTLAGIECLSRFREGTFASPVQYFEAAEQAGLRQQLESAAIRKALPCLRELPQGMFLSVNSSPGLLLSGALGQLLEGVSLSCLVVEITEHTLVEDYEALQTALRPLRQRGMRLAIDDAGAGYASMRHIVSLKPEFIKLDMSLVHGIDRDSSRRAMIKALIAFSEEVGSTLIAEGIETQAELEALRQLGVSSGQGYLLRRPAPLASALLSDWREMSIPSQPLYPV